jgi:hypothetical protein
MPLGVLLMATGLLHAQAPQAGAPCALPIARRYSTARLISGPLPAVRTVARALEVEGDRVAEEGTDNVGARHRSAYRLAAALPGAVVIVISQDGGVRFVAQKGGRVTYWEQE